MENSKIMEANNEIQKTVDYLIKNKTVWNDGRDLKLYDVAFYDFEKDFPLCFADNGNDNYYFQQFCEDSYENFQMWADEEFVNLKTTMQYIGSTSTFYLSEWNIHKMLYFANVNHTNKDIQSGKYDKIAYKEIIYEMIDDKFFEIDDCNIIDDNLKIIKNTYDNQDDYDTEIDYIINNLFDDVQYKLEDSIKIAKYVDGFKENQLNFFKEYLSNMEEDLMSENV